MKGRTEYKKKEYKVDKSRLVLPGDEIARAEEFIPGYGTYEDESGVVRASVVGYPKFEMSERISMVHSLTSTPPVIRKGDIVIGKIRDIRGPMAIVTIGGKRGVDRDIPSAELDATLHISKVSRTYMDDFSKALRMGDVVRAKVIQARPNVQLTISGPELGVIAATCPQCQVALIRIGPNKLQCPVCEHTSIRVLAPDYGEGKL